MRTIKKKYGPQNSLKIAGPSFNIPPDIDSREVDRMIQGGRRLPKDLNERIRRTRNEVQNLIKKA